MGKARSPDAPTSEANDSDSEPGFEGGLDRLEALVDRLEGGELELEEALAAFEEGVRLSARCVAQLDRAEQRVEILMRESGEWSTRPFEADESEEDSE